MKKALLLTISLIISNLTFAQSSKNDEKIIKEINALELKRFDAAVKKDYATLDKILSDNLFYTHSSGKVDSKESYIQSFKDGKTIYDAIESKEMNIHVFNGNTAVISGHCIFKLGGANPSDADLRYTDVYVKDAKKGWQMVSWNSAKLAAK